MKVPMKSNTRRNKQLAVIHMLANRLELGEEAYRNVLVALAGKRSAADLTDGERSDVIRFLGGVEERDEVIQA